MEPIPNFDAAWAAQLAQFCEESYCEQAAHVDAASDAAGQVDYVLLAEYALDAALVKYALGERLDQVTAWLARAAHAYVALFRNREAPGLSMLEATDQSLTEIAPVRSDNSLKNPQRALLAMYVALTAGELRLATAIAQCVEAGSGAWAAESQVACALKSLLLGNPLPDFDYCAPNDFPEMLSRQAAAIKAIARDDPGGFVQAHDAMMALHQREAVEEVNAREPRRFLCLPALGLAALSMSRKLITAERLAETITERAGPAGPDSSAANRAP
jgi:hypothetical protein